MRLVANLLCESEWADRGIPGRLLARTSGLGTLMRLLARPGDSVWTSTPVDPRRVPEVDGLPHVLLESGALSALRVDGVLAWGETDAVARARRPECALRPAPEGEHWLDVLRSLRGATPETQRRVTDRRRQLGFARSMKQALDRADVANSVDEVLSTSVARSGARWVAKAPWSAAGRDRLRGRGVELGDADWSRLSRLLAVNGALVVEPWLDRTDDFGAIGVVTAHTTYVVGMHRVATSGGGAWRGIRPLGGEGVPDWLSGSETRALIEALRATGTWLRSEGYEGAFGIDAWRYCDEHGASAFHALGEVNARLTFGFVARRAAELRGWDERTGGAAPELRVGGAEELHAAGPEAVILLRPGDDGVAAWIQ